MKMLKPALLRKGLAAMTVLPIVWLMARLPYVGWGLLVYSIISLATESFYTGVRDQLRQLFREGERQPWSDWNTDAVAEWLSQTDPGRS